MKGRAAGPVSSCASGDLMRITAQFVLGRKQTRIFVVLSRSVMVVFPVGITFVLQCIRCYVWSDVDLK